MKNSIFITLATLLVVATTARASDSVLQRVTCQVSVNDEGHATVWNAKNHAYEFTSNGFEASIILQDINGVVYATTVVNEIGGALISQSGFMPIPSPATGSNWMGDVNISKKLGFTFFCEPKKTKNTDTN